MSFSQTASVC